MFLMLACNVVFWRAFVAATGGFSMGRLPLYVATLLIFALLLNALLTLLAFRPIVKPMLVLLFFASALATYFMGRFGVVIDPTVMQTVFETDLREATELLSWRLLFVVLLLGVLPAALVLRWPLGTVSPWRDLAARLVASTLCLLAAGGLLLANYKTYAPTFREHGEFRHMVTPLNYVYATARYFGRTHKVTVVTPIGTDAVKGPLWVRPSRRTVAVIVVGETARAMNFSLNGYARPTNPALSAERGLINFTNVSSCGTVTAVSLPCVFSGLGRKDYSDSKARSRQGLLDVLSHAGFEVVWRDNNSGCKGVCDRVRYEEVFRPAPGNPFCNGDECYDERLLENLPSIIHASSGDMVIVLHQKGSHGPAYWQRYPPEYEKWKPVCRTVNLDQCQTEAIVAAYDNTILYTDHVLAKAIETLRQVNRQEGIDTALMYFSDHGESLGERGLYLHGTPYLFSPEEQRRVPMMVWFSDGYPDRFQIDAGCVAARSGEALSHDNVFHSVLGMLDVNTAVYDPSLDLFNACRRASHARIALRGSKPVDVTASLNPRRSAPARPRRGGRRG